MCARDAQAFQRRKPYPPRVTRGSYAEYISPKKTGLPYVRQVYSGYSHGFPPPAFLYYGYPHSGDDTGIGPLDRQ
jgi:hypothetical protein